MVGPRLDGDDDRELDLDLVFGARRTSRFGTPVRGGGRGAFREGSGRPGAPAPGEPFRPSRDLAAKRDAFAAGAHSGSLSRPVRAWDDDLDSGSAAATRSAAPAAARPIIPGERRYPRRRPRPARALGRRHRRDVASSRAATRRSRSRSRTPPSGARRCSRASPTSRSSGDRPRRRSTGSPRCTSSSRSPAAVMDHAAFDYVAGGSWDEITLDENEAAWRRRRLPAARARRRLVGRPVDHDARRPGRHPGRGRADGGPGPRPSRRRAGHGPRRGRGRRAVHPVDDVVALDRGGRRGGPGRGRAGSSSTSRPTPPGPGGSSSAPRPRGIGAIVLTVDLPVLGYRERDRRSGFELPPLGNFARSRRRTASHGRRRRLRVAATQTSQPRPGTTWRRSGAGRGLPLVLKGDPDRRGRPRSRSSTASTAIVVSNHGGRQLDRVQAAVDALAEVVAAVGGRTEVWVDGGVRRGLDVAIALALGARGVLVGPAGLLGAGGRRAGRRRACARDPSRGVRDRPGAPRRAGRPPTSARSTSSARARAPPERPRTATPSSPRPASPAGPHSVAGWRSSGPLLGAR